MQELQGQGGTPSYEVGDAGANVCRSGSSPISTESECTAAASALTLSYQSAGSWPVGWNQDGRDSPENSLEL